jgi:hypothetical protein
MNRLGSVVDDRRFSRFVRRSRENGPLDVGRSNPCQGFPVRTGCQPVCDGEVRLGGYDLG